MEIDTLNQTGSPPVDRKIKQRHREINYRDYSLSVGSREEPITNNDHRESWPYEYHYYQRPVGDAVDKPKGRFHTQRLTPYHIPVNTKRP